ncbi:hypothetical protein GCM10008995_09500 [Halobellus salinus]|uniref:2-oxoacid dehydrogenase acyltransferase catalytic domain-containing protein n=1 Tax=Halobellus salinus TaxID=931585 RepID=A0A830E962_9EURY|nr:2-oxo acid dehydrogenase subunit E2 [Halobellus salinus]GGJ01800.1 hypothetical protein GCM10008995_09500 [Halobellus salinus]SMP18210.1 2-oxoacid dehydrogenases acyltransferase (catalytic domain) [Halobellus salinus]
MPGDDPAERTVASERSLSPMRRTIASRLQESYREAVHVTVSREVSATAALAASDVELDGDGSVSPSVTDVLLRALSDSLADHPSFNATFEDGTHRIYEQHNIGVAVDIDEGLVTPVLEDVGSKSLAEITRERRRLTDRVRAGEYSMSTFENGTFTVSNLGPLGSDFFTPVINPPEVAILGVNRIREAVVPATAAEGRDAGNGASGDGGPAGDAGNGAGGDGDPAGDAGNGAGGDGGPAGDAGNGASGDGGPAGDAGNGAGGDGGPADGRFTTDKRMTLDLSFDHRVVDGADAARFLGTLADHLNDADAYVG